MRDSATQCGEQQQQRIAGDAGATVYSNGSAAAPAEAEGGDRGGSTGGGPSDSTSSFEEDAVLTS